MPITWRFPAGNASFYQHGAAPGTGLLGEPWASPPCDHDTTSPKGGLREAGFVGAFVVLAIVAVLVLTLRSSESGATRSDGLD
jgi:hypothetical protein